MVTTTTIIMLTSMGVITIIIMRASMNTGASMCMPMGPDILTHIAPMKRPARTC